MKGVPTKQRKVIKNDREGLSIWKVTKGGEVVLWKLTWFVKEKLKDFSNYALGSLIPFAVAQGKERGSIGFSIRKNTISNLVNIYLEAVTKEELAIFKRTIDNKLNDL